MKHTIKADDIVEVELTNWGSIAVAATLDRQCSDALGDGAPPRKVSGPKMIKLGLADAVRILGPLTPSALRVPFGNITISLPEDPAVKRLQDAYEALEARANRDRKLLIELTKAMGLGSTEYCSPEELGRRAHEWIHATVTTNPTCAGHWWLGDKVARVEATDGQGLMVVLGNGRRKSVDGFDGWGGRARRDPRVPELEGELDSGPADEDIPF